MEHLYAINDTLSALAAEYNVRERFGSDDEYDEWLNDLTHHVAKELGVDD